MTDSHHFYDTFSRLYDRFVDWEGRLEVEIPFLRRQLCLKKPSFRSGYVLDAACGTGHHAIALANQGFHVVGIDLSPLMIEEATSLDVRGTGSVDFRVGDMVNMVDDFEVGSWHGILCLGNALPHILDQSRLLKTFKGFKKLLTVGGQVILQINNYEKILSDRNRWLPPADFQEGEKLWIFSRFYDFDRDDLLTFNILIISKDGSAQVEQQVISTQLRPWKRGDLLNSLRQSGFKNFRIFGDLQGHSFQSSESPNLVISAF